MIYEYKILNMKCSSCVDSIRGELLKLPEISEAIIQLADPQAILTMRKQVPLPRLQTALNKAGDYTLMQEEENNPPLTNSKVSIKTWFTTYKPILIIGAYLVTISLTIELSQAKFSLEHWMSHFMSGFFLVFSFFKFLDLKGFAASYFTYDVIAKHWYNWSYVYAFIELALGIGYILKPYLLVLNSITLVVTSLSLWGVLQSVFKKREIQCACLGTIFNLPLSTLTIVEGVLMIFMSGLMLLLNFRVC